MPAHPLNFEVSIWAMRQNGCSAGFDCQYINAVRLENGSGKSAKISKLEAVHSEKTCKSEVSAAVKCPGPILTRQTEPGGQEVPLKVRRGSA